jgi:uncharacterized membrane-anchored protein YhcB (DUF1043 family)
MNYPLSNWIGLLEYCGIVLVLSIFIGAVSCILVNKILHKKRKNNYKAKKTEKKSYFIDVA